jgi:predicted  nucleic acid-binding Zn-ribbon protein
VKASQSQQDALLALAALDLEISRTKREISALQNPDRHAEQVQQQRALASSLIDARNEVDRLELELARANQDLDLVEQRITKDKTALAASSSSKDAVGLEHELTTLARRKGELEEASLAVMEQLELAKDSYEQVLICKRELDASIQQLAEADEQALIKLKSGLQLHDTRRTQLQQQVGEEIFAAYQRRAAKGIAAGRLESRACSACQFTLDAIAFDKISSLANDELTNCPDCDALLVR